MSTPAGDGLVGDATIRVDGDTDPALRALTRFSRDANGRLRDLRGRFVSESRLMSGSVMRAAQAVRGLGAAAASAAPQMGTSGGGLGAAMGGLAAVAGASLLPAIGALVPAMAGAGLAAGVLTVAFSGVSDAVALAGEDTEKYREALKEMGPEQRDFTKAIVGLRKEFAPFAKEIRKVALPGFTKAVKDAGPVVKILGQAMTEMAAGFGDAARGVGRLLKDSGFQDSLQKNLKLGNRLVQEMTRSMGPFVRSLLDFGAASGPTLKAFSDGIGGILRRGLPGFFQGLTPGIGGAARALDGLFSAVNNLLPALGRLAGEVARDLGPIFGEVFERAGANAAAAMDGLRSAMVALRPVFRDLTFGARTINDLFKIIGPTAKDTALAIVGGFAPVGSAVNETVGPLQRLHGWVQANKGAIQEAARIFAGGVIEMTRAAVNAVPRIISIFKLMSATILVALDGIVSGAARAFGWIPGIGGRLKKANAAFDEFKDGYLRSLNTAERKAQEFADSTDKRLSAGKLKLNISNWEAQIKTAKGQLKSVPPEKQAALKAKISDLRAKVRLAKDDLASLRDRTVTVTTNYVVTGQTARRSGVQGTQLGFASGGLARFAAGGGIQGYPHGGLLRGRGTGTSDSILARVSDGEFVVRAAAVRRYGVSLFEALNTMRVPRPAAPAPAVGSVRTSRSAPSGAPVTNVNNFYLQNHGAIGSRLELLEWLEGMLENLKVQRRLPSAT